MSAEKVAIIARALDQVDRRGFDPADLAAGEALLTEHAAVFPPEDLRLLADRIVDAINPDGTLPDDELNEDRRYFHLRPTRDGAYVGDFRLTGSLGAKLKTLLDPLAKPRGRPRRGRRADRTMHDALTAATGSCGAETPDAGGIPATVIVTIDPRDPTGSAGRTRRRGLDLGLANNADIIPAVLTATGAVLDLAAAGAAGRNHDR